MRDQDDPATRPARATSLESRHRPGFVSKPELQEKLEKAEAEAARLRTAMASSQIAMEPDSTNMSELTRKIDAMADAMLKTQMVMQVLLEEREAKLAADAQADRAAQTPLHTDSRMSRGGQRPQSGLSKEQATDAAHQMPGSTSANHEPLEAKTPFSQDP